MRFQSSVSQAISALLCIDEELRGYTRYSPMRYYQFWCKNTSVRPMSVLPSLVYCKISGLSVASVLLSLHRVAKSYSASCPPYPCGSPCLSLARCYKPSRKRHNARIAHHCCYKKKGMQGYARLRRVALHVQNNRILLHLTRFIRVSIVR